VDFTSEDWLQDILLCQAELHQERTQFEKGPLNVLKLFKVERKGWLNSNECPEADRTRLPDSKEMKKKLASVKLQQEKVNADLQDEHHLLYGSLQAFESAWFDEDGEAKMRGRGVPASIAAMECSDPALKSSLMDEFGKLSQLTTSHLPQARLVALITQYR